MTETTARHWTREDILPLLGPVKRSGDETMAFCPAHRDGETHKMKGGHSLSVRPDGTVHCFAGCTWPAIEAALVARSNGHGPAPRREATERPRVKRDGSQWALIEAYEYRSPDGTLVAVKSRHERPDPDSEKGYEKTFQWRLPDSQKWDGLHGTVAQDEMPMWGVEGLVELPAKQRVWFAEGEKAAKAIRAAGEFALCLGYGSAQRKFGPDDAPSLVFEPLRGRDVFLWPDNDAGGREFMVHVRRAMRGIAKSVTTVSAPVPPKGDAYEYFKAGGKVDDLLHGIILEPTVDVLAIDRFTVRMPGDSGGVIGFEFEDVLYRKDTLEANLTVRTSWDEETYDQYINLKSQSTREGLIRVLKAQFPDQPQNWTRAVTVAYSRLKKAYNETPRAIQVDALPDYGDNTFMVDTLVPLGTTTVFFGRGKSGKSTLVKALALEIAMGGAWLGHKVLHPGPVIVVDYEDARAVKREFRRLLEGAGLDPNLLAELPIHFWPTHGEPLQTQVPGLRRFVEQTEAVAMLVDSAMPACGGEPEKPEPALSFFNGLNALGLTNLVVSHVSWGELESGMRRPYGNVAWENMPRRLWAVHTDTEAKANPRDVMLKCTAANGAWPDPISYRTYFRGHPDTGPIEFVRTEIADTPAFTHALPLQVQLRMVLAEAPEGLEVPAICERLAGNPKADAVRAALNRAKHLFEPETRGYGRGARTLWRLATYDPVCVRCGAPATGRNDSGMEACEEHGG